MTVWFTVTSIVTCRNDKMSSLSDGKDYSLLTVCTFEKTIRHYLDDRSD